MKLRDWRKKKGWTQAELAKRLGTRAATITHYESFKRVSIRVSMMKNIFALTEGQVTPNDLYEMSEDYINEFRNQHSSEVNNYSWHIGSPYSMQPKIS